jgi:hypothetical protein
LTTIKIKKGSLNLNPSPKEKDFSFVRYSSTTLLDFSSKTITKLANTLIKTASFSTFYQHLFHFKLKGIEKSFSFGEGFRMRLIFF